MTTPLFEDELVAVVAPSHPFAKRSHVEPETSPTSICIVYNRRSRRQLHRSATSSTPAGVEPARVSQVPLTEAILELVKAGLGVSVMARWAIEPAIKTGAVRAVRIGRRGVFRGWPAVIAARPASSRSGRRNSSR